MQSLRVRYPNRYESIILLARTVRTKFPKYRNSDP